MKKCCFCDAVIPAGHGNNPDPLNTKPNAVCCSDCDKFVVLARIAIARALNEQQTQAR